MTAELLVALPVLVLAAGAALLVLLHEIAPADERAVVWLASVIALAAGVTALAGPDGATIAGLVRHDPRAVVFTVLATGAAALAMLAGVPQAGATRVPAAHVAALLLLSTAGALVVVAAQDLVVALVGFVLASLPLHVLGRVADREAGVRDASGGDLLLGMSGAALMALGIALVWAASGSTDVGIAGVAGTPLARVGLALVLAAIAAAAGLVPFSFGAAGSRASAATGIAAFRVLVPGIAAFALLLRIADPVTLTAPLDWRVTMAALAAATIAVPTLAALVERSLRRVVLFAAIAQLGYAAVGLAAGSAAAGAVATMLALTALTTIGGFAALAALGPGVSADGLRGLARTSPLAAAALGLVLLAAAGVPPTAGFVARVYVLEAATAAQLAWLVAVGALAGAAWAVVALRVLASALRDGMGEWSRGDPVSRAVLAVCALAVTALGIVPGPLLEAMEQARF